MQSINFFSETLISSYGPYKHFYKSRLIKMYAHNGQFWFSENHDFQQITSSGKLQECVDEMSSAIQKTSGRHIRNDIILWFIIILLICYLLLYSHVKGMCYLYLYIYIYIYIYIAHSYQPRLRVWYICVCWFSYATSST